MDDYNEDYSEVTRLSNLEAANDTYRNIQESVKDALVVALQDCDWLSKTQKKLLLLDVFQNIKDGVQTYSIQDVEFEEIGNEKL